MEEYKQKFFKYPSTLDFDKVDFLPTSRYIQRNFGGIVKLRGLLKLDAISDYTKGEYRSCIAKAGYHRAVKYEEVFYNYLISKIPEVQVHEHKIIRPGNICCDFFIYTNSQQGIAIDLFYAQDIFSLARVINIKLKRYSNLKISVYFILIENLILSQDQIDLLMQNRKLLLPKNIKVITEKLFKQNIMPKISQS